MSPSVAYLGKAIWAYKLQGSVEYMLSLVSIEYRILMMKE